MPADLSHWTSEYTLYSIIGKKTSKHTPEIAAASQFHHKGIKPPLLPAIDTMPIPTVEGNIDGLAGSPCV